MAEYLILKTQMLALKLWSHKSHKQFHISILLFTENWKKKISCAFQRWNNPESMGIYT